MKRKKKNYIYSNKKHTLKGIFSFILSMISLLSLILTIILSYVRKGDAPTNYGAVGFLCTLFCAVGIILALYGRKEPDKFYLFANLGLAINIADLLLISAILYAGT